MSNKPIGLFDSGVGGTSIFKEISQLLPYEDTIYLADSRNAPYGEKTKDQIIDLSIKNTEFLLSKGCKLIVVACNTATTNSIDILRNTYSVPFIGIEPAFKPAALQTKTHSIGILATKGTLSSSLFHKTSNLYGGDIKVLEIDGDGIVPLIEAGKLDSKDMRNLLWGYIKPMLVKNIDYLVLGCTHYPYLLPILREMLPPTIKVIDSGEAVAKQTKEVLIGNGLLNSSETKANHCFYSNGNIKVLKQFIPDHSQLFALDF